ncbi:MAG: RecX family transcriptional regulator [Bacteroidia bacterium]|nr:RecX family transcriptional regulator [Bacteroidia bacterium]
MEEEVWNKIIRYCAYRERSVAEIRKKITQLGITNLNRQNKIITALKTLGIASDEKFVRAFVSGKVRINRWGPEKIIFELKSHQIEPGLIKKTMESFREEIEQNCLQLISLKIQHKNKIIHTEKLKIMRYLYAKGYPVPLIEKCMSAFSEIHED